MSMYKGVKQGLFTPIKTMIANFPQDFPGLEDDEEDVPGAPVVDLGAFIAELVVEAHKRKTSSRTSSLEAISRKASDLQRILSPPPPLEEEKEEVSQCAGEEEKVGQRTQEKEEVGQRAEQEEVGQRAEKEEVGQRAEKDEVGQRAEKAEVGQRAQEETEVVGQSAEEEKVGQRAQEEEEVGQHAQEHCSDSLNNQVLKAAFTTILVI